MATKSKGHSPSPRHPDVPDNHPDRNLGPGTGVKQDHNYTPGKSYFSVDHEKHPAGSFPGKGETPDRSYEASNESYSGRKVCSAADGNNQREARRRHIEANKKASEAVFDAHRRTTSAVRRKNAANADRLPQ
jgi:hypothetical protein